MWFGCTDVPTTLQGSKDFYTAMGGENKNGARMRTKYGDVLLARARAEMAPLRTAQLNNPVCVVWLGSCQRPLQSDNESSIQILSAYNIVICQ